MISPKLLKSINEDLITSMGQDAEKLRPLNGKCIFITGGTGFVGSWITRLVCLLNDNFGFNILLKLMGRNVEDFISKHPDLNRKDIEFIGFDIRHHYSFPPNVNYIIHAAGNPDARYHASEPIRTIETFVNGTFNILESASRLPELHNFVHISSGLVYGRCESIDYYSENIFGSTDCSLVISAYTESKRMSETIATTFRSQYRLPVVIARPFTFIGPSQDLEKPWAFNNILRDALVSKKIDILGNGEVKRGYMYGSDMAFWILSILANAKSGSIYNVGSNQGIMLKDVANNINSILGDVIKISYGQFEGVLKNNFNWVPDTQKASNDLNLSLKVDFERAIRRTIEWHLMHE